ncbi:trypsin-like peptidase domain-containing protein [Flavobacteriaceae bacterium]|jgi:Do/DeqQ family serine protease|nr:trypsin-like peptidase domain-containing protein [Flavobacteriaceae bacterium]MDB3997676.1 trypsin-like peptidase domain-containing protein [Flavobacteriaceae bacterium]MDC0875280.1 trypsin-like peptidase domain-containing protein [Flavobacteriaceae bacterium]
MKSFIKTLGIALSSAFLSIFIYDVYFNSASTENSDNSPKPKLIPTNYTYTSSNAAAELTDFTIAAEKTVHAVVHVKNTSSSGTELSDFYRYFYGDDEFPERIGTGSGVIVSPNGYIITNHHVIENNSEIEITTNDNKIYKATVVGSDPSSDIAVLKINTDQKLPYVFFGNSDTTKIGEWVLAVGNPFNLNSTVTAGIISAKARDLNQRDGKNEWYIQTDAAVNQGNSGGALVNTRGELIGINTAITSISGGFVGYSFAVPSNVARKVFEDIIEFGDVQQGLLGVMGQALNSEMAERYEVKETEGFYITDLEEGLGADLAGLRPNDIIKSVDNITINKFADLSGYLASKRPGENVNIVYNRNGVENEVKVRLEKINRANFFLMEVRELTPDQKKKYQTQQGLYISNMNNRWLYQRGVDNGYIILEINNREVNKLKEVRNLKVNDIESILFLKPSGEKERISLRY